MNARILALAALSLLVSASVLRAEFTLFRSWRDQDGVLSVKIVAKIEIQPGYWGPPKLALAAETEPPANTEPPVWHPPVTTDRDIFVKLQFDRPAPLRIGELETFRITPSHAFGQSAIAIELKPDQTVWTYSGRTQAFVPVGHPGGTGREGANDTATFTLHPYQRHPIRPPNVLTGLKAGTRGAADPLVIELDDPGRADDGHAATAYLFKVVRKRNLWPDRTLAAGTFRPIDAASHQSIVIEKGGAYHAGGEFLVEGATYFVTLQLQKFGQDYTAQPSDEARFQFTFHSVRATYSREAARRVNYGRMRP